MLFISCCCRALYSASLLAAFGVVLLAMTDTGIDLSEITGTIKVPPELKTGYGSYFSLPSTKQWLRSCKESIKPWSQFANTSNFKAPPSIPRLLKRSANNLQYFQGNYFIVSLVLLAYSLLTSPLLLISIFASVVACYMLYLRNKERKLSVGGKEVPLQQQYGVVGLCSLPLYYWAGVGQAVFWVIGASCFLISIHAGFYNIESILSEEDQVEFFIQQV